jgi:hypothetical protein
VSTTTDGLNGSDDTARSFREGAVGGEEGAGFGCVVENEIYRSRQGTVYTHSFTQEYFEFYGK